MYTYISIFFIFY